MNRTLTTILVAAGIAGAGAAPAGAEFRSVEADLAVAERYWHIDESTHPCVGKWHVIGDPTLAGRGFERRGEATGIGWVRNDETGEHAGDELGGAPGRWDWFIDRCEFALDPTVKGCAREAAIRHEVGHFVAGPHHAGRMAPRVLRAVPCTQPNAYDAVPPMPTRAARAAYRMPQRAPLVRSRAARGRS